MESQEINPTLRASFKYRGFTLIEVLIAVIIIAVLASVAMPSFLDAIRKGRRSEAFTAINAVQQAQERFRANNQSFATDMLAATTAVPPGLGLPSTTTPSGYYTLTLDTVTGTTYNVTATAVAGTSQANDTDCTWLRIRVDRGNMTNEAVGNRCWSR